MSIKKQGYYKKITAKQQGFSIDWRELWEYRELISVMTKRNFQVRYRQTILGPLWVLVAPVISSLISFIAFGTIAHMGTDGVPSALFYLSGNAFWLFFTGCVNNNANIFRNNAYLFNKVYFPRLAMTIAYVLTGLLDFGINLIVILCMMGFYALKGTIMISFLGLLCVPFIMCIVGILGMSIGLVISSLTTRYRDFSVMLTFILSLWMPLTPVSYPMSEISNPLMKYVFSVNPITGLIELFRYSLFGKGTILTGNLIWGCSLTLILFVLGVMVFSKVEKSVMDTV